VARKQQAGKLTVAQALGRLGRGETSAEVSVRLQELLRALSDAGAYRSLLDPDNIDRLLAARGM
jgi:hypothetical protein